MLIVADENIPYAKDVFSQLGEVRCLGGRAMQNAELLEADALMVRSVTRVNQELLEDTKVKFVATATIGIDHIDRNYLNSRGIGFASAAGCNATSVAEYIITALSLLSKRGIDTSPPKVMGIIGVGNVGSRLETRARILGYDILLCDPPRARREGADKFVELDELLARADIISVHVPLERGGEDPTHHLINESFIAKSKRGVVLLNSSRGAVGDTKALKNALADKHLGALVLDVWENEPKIDIELARGVNIATPHIAGYSFDGKVAGTRMIFEATVNHFGLAHTWPSELPPDDGLYLEVLDTHTRDDIILNTYDIARDDRALRTSLDTTEPAKSFDLLRKEYPRRREFSNWQLKGNLSSEMNGTLRQLGYNVSVNQIGS